MENFRYIKILKIVFLLLLFLIALFADFFILWIVFFALSILAGIDFYFIKQATAEYHRLYHSAYFDSLTGIPNRQSADLFCSRYDSADSLCVAIADLNNLKMTNDTFGHQAGDLIIQKFAALLSETVSQDGFAARNGGDEFLVIFDTKDPCRQIETFCTKLKNAVNLYNEHAEHPISYSIGCASGKETNYQNVSELISHAEQRMYQQKMIYKASVADAKNS